MSDLSSPNSAPAHIVYCPSCATKLVTRKVGDKNRRACPSCNYIHFTDPKVGVGVLVIDEGKILLVKRKMNPEQGKWSLPAGFLDYGENPKETAEREVFEETNLIVHIQSLLEIYHNPEAVENGGASIFILYQARLEGGEIKAGDDASQAAFFGPGELPEIAFSSSHDVITRWQVSMRAGAKNDSPVDGSILDY
jgi:ADP-ribose pyrophosphatase YjhB (NUDIX family)